MTRQVRIDHRTTYRYDRPVQLGSQTIRLRPTRHMHNELAAYRLIIGPSAAVPLWQEDRFGNTTASITFSERVTSFTVDVKMIVGMTAYDPVHSHPPDVDRLRPVEPGYTSPVVTPEALRALLDPEPVEAGDPDLVRMMRLNRRIAAHLTYMRRLEPGVWSPEETLSRQAGSCRDSAWLLISVARSLGYPARFVSGYLIEPSPAPEDLDRLACDLHAWAEIWLDGHGWMGFDTTSGLIAAQNHIPLAASDTPEEAAPICGLLDQCQSHFDVLMTAAYLP